MPPVSSLRPPPFYLEAMGPEVSSPSGERACTSSSYRALGAPDPTSGELSSKGGPPWDDVACLAAGVLRLPFHVTSLQECPALITGRSRIGRRDSRSGADAVSEQPRLPTRDFHLRSTANLRVQPTADAGADRHSTKSSWMICCRLARKKRRGSSRASSEGSERSSIDA
jgi:hypothetical protein